MKNDRPFEVGDKVFCLLYGHGTVETNIAGFGYPVGVKFESGRCESYSQDGKPYQNSRRTLYHANSGFIAIDTNAPLPELDVDTPVWVRRKGDSAWQPAHFAMFARRLCCCWADGRTSHTEDVPTPWEEYRLEPPECTQN